MCLNKQLILNCYCYIAILETILLHKKPPKKQMSSSSFRNVINEKCLQIIFKINILKGFSIK